MAKKRKAGGKPFGQSTDTAPKVRTSFGTEEVFDDSEDEFYAGRDKVLLDERPDAKRRRRIEEEDEFLQPSDEEVLGYDEPSDEEIDEEDVDDYNTDQSRSMDDEEEEEILGDFGTSKQDYYNADTIETEADALEEEREARRIQQKQLESMTEADFGFDEGQWLEQVPAAQGQRTVTERLPELEIKEDLSKEERLKILQSRYPEFEALAEDFVNLQPVYEDLRLAVGAAEAVAQRLNSPSHKRKRDATVAKPSPVSIAVTKYRALSAYLGTVSMYFALLTASSKSGLPMPPSDLRDHAIIRSLFQCRQLWETVKDIPVPPVEDVNVPEPIIQEHAAAEPSPIRQLQEKQSKKRRKAERDATAAAESGEATRKARIAATEASLADLDDLIRPAKVYSLDKYDGTPEVEAQDGNVSDFGDETPLTAEEAAAKAQRKKSLRFYTSQITNKTNKRGAASRDAGGDTDLPYKERLKDRQARLNREAEKRGTTGADLNSGSEEEGPTNLDREKNEEPVSDEEDYYQTISTLTSAKKSTKSALSAAHAEAARQNGKLTNIEETIAPDGKRAITYAISKNKGLTPHRKKDVRNPRVKKRKKFEEKMKKLGSVRQVYKGGEGRGGYGGELTGINRGVVRSVKL